MDNEETIIYGHNRMNKIMFAELSEYMNEDFFNSHRDFYIYTPTENYIAKIFSVYSITESIEKNNLKLLDFDGKIDYYKTQSKYKVNSIEQVDKIVKLSTCSYLNTKKRTTDKRLYIIASIENLKYEEVN